MQSSNRERITISLTSQEKELLSQKAKIAGITCNQYAKRAALEEKAEDIIMRTAVVKTMSQLYLTVETLESIEDRKKIRAVADALWQCLR